MDNLHFRNEEGGEFADASYENEYLWGTLRSQISSSLFSQTVFSVNNYIKQRSGSYVDTFNTSANVRDDRSTQGFGIRQSWTMQLAAKHFLRWGFHFDRSHADYSYFSESATTTPLEVLRNVNKVDVDPDGNNLGLYAADRFQLTKHLTTEVGLRWDRQSYTDESYWSPRANVVYQKGAIALRGAWGYFYQPQRIDELQVEDGVNTFFPAQLSEHRVITFEEHFNSFLQLRVDAYQKKLKRIRPRFENLFTGIELFLEVLPDRILIAPDRGDAKGVEVSVKGALGNWDWLLVYSRSSVIDEEDGVRTPRSWANQMHSNSI